MLYLNEVFSHVAPKRRTVQDMAGELELTPQDVSVFRTVFGLREIAVVDEGGALELLDAVLARLVATTSIDLKQIKYIFHCHAAPCVCPSGAELLQPLKKKYGLEHATSIGLAQDQCATPLTALSLAEILLADEADDAKVLILTGEVGFTPKLRLISNTTIIGDASAACIVGKQGTRNAVLTVAQRKFEMADVQQAVGSIPVPATSYGDDLLQVVRDALDQASMRLDQLALIVIHNVNTISWKFFARNFPCPLELIYLDNIAKAGHCFTSDPFINYCDAVAAGRLKAGDHFMMVSVGTSSSFAAVILQH
ncbi:3-oxoacyl-[acyl-carrier-protein] synthase III C-terminal domain-containing protein [Uliginosibacterium sp. H3]|uniref:3-oxoacyl-[acyl-carrier-protein] synthase III C-terminal domain-containing protein n=1 Tax=Uliginosibacterium silvisoli TaxID=3114758 RepID=A0ABU6K7F2_9RHOO|nr:3-oxoacyl-[acyl-carrier-protein] synthase III C-terminal domain-containing protein [Uliginosibacterium sp. H3]